METMEEYKLKLEKNLDGHELSLEEVYQCKVNQMQFELEREKERCDKLIKICGCLVRLSEFYESCDSVD